MSILAILNNGRKTQTYIYKLHNNKKPFYNKILKKITHTNLNPKMSNSNNTHHNITSSGQIYSFQNQNGQLNVMGNGNMISLTACQGRINVMGNQNNITLIQSAFDVSVNGNGNRVMVEEGKLGIGVNGNGNQVKQISKKAPNHDPFWSRPNAAITVSHNNGINNIIPGWNKSTYPQNQNTNNYGAWNNIPSYGMNGQYGFIGLPNMGNYNQYPYSNSYGMPMMPPPQPMMVNPMQALFQSSMQNQNSNYNPFQYNNHEQEQNGEQPSRRTRARSRFNIEGMNNGRTVYNPQPQSRRRERDRRQQSRSYRFGRQQEIILVADSDDDNHQISIRPARNGPNIRQTQSRLLRFNPNNQPVRYAFQTNDTIPGLSQQQLAQLPKSKHTGKNSKCSICLEDVRVGNQVTYFFCFHSFHSECAFAWLRKSATCPLCQLNLRPLFQQKIGH